MNSNIQTIRYYDEINLLKPNKVDKYTLYRYYNEDNIREYYVIIFLKQMGFTLDEIRENMDNLNDELFIKQREKILKEIIEKENILKTIDMIRSNIVDGNFKMNDYMISNITTKKISRGEIKNEKKVI